MSETTTETPLPGMPEAPEAPEAPAEVPADETAPRRRGRPRKTPGAAASSAPARERKPRSRTATGAQKSRKDIEKAVCGLHDLAAMGLGFSGMPMTAQALAQAGPVAAPVLAPMIERNPWLLRLITTGENGAAILQLLLVYQAVYSAAVAERAAIAEAKKAGVPYTPPMPDAGVPTS